MIFKYTTRGRSQENSNHLGPVVLDAHTGHGLARVIAQTHHKNVRALPLATDSQLRKHRAHLRQRPTRRHLEYGATLQGESHGRGQLTSGLGKV